MTLSSPRHIAALLDEFGMGDAKPNANPMAKGTAVGKGELLGDNNRYAELFGSLTYLANWTQPDIAFAVGRLSHRMASPSAGDLATAKAVLRYLKGTKEMGLRFPGKADLAGCVDANWAGDVASRKSTTGLLFALHVGSIACRSRLQTLMTDTTADAEFVAASEAAKDSLYLRRVWSANYERTSSRCC